MTKFPDDSPDFREQFLDDYYAECEEHLASIRRNLLAVESQAGEGRVDVGILDELFRSFHTIKGISGMVGLGAAEQLAHSIEGVLRMIRQAEMPLDVARLDALVDAVSRLEDVIAASRAGDGLPGIDDVVSDLEELSTSEAAAGAVASSLRINKPEKLHDAAPGRVWSVIFTPTPALAELGLNVTVVRERLQGLGEIIRATPQVQGDGEISFQFIVETAADLATFPDWTADGIIVEPYPASGQAAAPEGPRTAPAKGSHLQGTSSNVVRVDLARLDNLMQMIGEMVISRARLDEGLKQAQRSLPAGEWRALWQTNQAIHRQLRNLREGVMRVRMVPIGEIFDRMQFVVRDLARESGKKVRIEPVGRETEIDKFLVERMMDPLLHLVRNAVSHGLERPDERTARGKPPEGRLTLRATTTGENVIIQIEDDGAGVDRARVEEQAKARGLLPAGGHLDEAGLLQVISMPGFSTRTAADRASGRGIGMDVVKKTIEELNGRLAMTTAENAGTVFTIELPLTLAIADAFIVNVGDQTYAVPQTAVREVIEVQRADIRELERNEVAPYRNGAVPLIRLSRLFNLASPRETDRSSLHVIVTGSGNNVVGIAVDRIIGHREIVVRGINDTLAHVPGIGGATDLGDERVVLIIDVASLRRIVLEGSLTRAVG